MTKFRQMRKQSGLSVHDLATVVGLNDLSIYRYEQGVRLPTIDVAAKIASALKCSITDLLEDNLISEETDQTEKE